MRPYNAVSRATCAECAGEQRRARQKVRRAVWREANPRVRTGAPWLNSGGYPMLYRPGHPNASSVGAIAAHRWVMAEHVGRPLEPNETVHHRNGDKLDYRLENLELWCSSHAAGQRVEDLVAWAHEILERYGQGAVHSST